jgi:hypothetical protein
MSASVHAGFRERFDEIIRSLAQALKCDRFARPFD